MQIIPTSNKISRHLRVQTPSPWVVRFAPLVKKSARILDLACGNGRHGRLFLSDERQVTFVDLTDAPLSDLRAEPQARLIAADLESGAPWPLAEDRFDAVIVTNYLHRPLFETIINALEPGGVLIYETFARGNEVHGRPRNPDHLLACGELLALVGGRLQIVAYEHGVKTEQPLPGVVQRLCAVNDLGLSDRADGDPAPHPLTPDP